MSDLSNHTDLFDRYLRRELTDSEREAFEQRLGTDMAFKEAFELHSLLAEGIREAGRAELKQYLKDHAPAGSATVKPIRRLYYAAAAIAILGVCLYLVNLEFGPSSLKEQQKNAVVLNDEQEQKAPEPLKQKQEAPADSTPPVLKGPEIVRNEDYPVEQEEATVMTAEPDDAGILNKETAAPPVIVESGKGNADLNLYDYQQAPALNSSQEIVLSDKKTFDTAVFAVLVPDAPVFTNSAGNVYRNKMILPRNNTVLNENNVLIPDTIGTDREAKVSKKSKNKAETKDDEEQAPEYIIEFWKSPLNYKGYSFNKNVIQLFGLTSRQVQLLQYDNKFYLKADNEYYLLEPTEKFQPYKPVTEEPVIKQLLTH